MDELAQRGISPVDAVDMVGQSENLIVRTHGVGKSVYDEMESRGIGVVDVTCPFVKKIHNIVEKHHREGYAIVIIGDKNHPEVRGINGWCENAAVILATEEEAKKAKFGKNRFAWCRKPHLYKIFSKKLYFF